MSDKPVRVRVAPSPTGDPHVGTAYQALFNYAFAKSRGGQFVLRIEDTDRTRSTKESENAILESLTWLGIPWDEGPDVGGPHGPYRQSERAEIYRELAQQLIDSGRAYRSFLTKEQLDKIREERKDTGWHGFRDEEGRGLAPKESEARAAAGESFVVRLVVPDEGDCVMNDLLRDEIRKEWKQIDDQILLKSDGFPTYHLANVVDDHLMGISHVIRGEEWISSLPKHLLLYEAFGWEAPTFCHLALLRNTDRSKLSKRKNPVSIRYFRDAGYLPQALVNYLGLMGWSMPGDEDKFTLAQMVDAFRLEDVSLGGPIFDVEKLNWLNGRYIREDHSPAQLRDTLTDWGYSADKLEKIAELAQPRLEKLTDWATLTSFFFRDDVEPAAEDLTVKGAQPDQVMRLLQLTVWRFEQLRAFDAETIESEIKALAEKLEIKIRELMAPMYVAISGSRSSTPLYQSMEILGSDMVRMRLRRAIEALGGLSGKKRKAAEKEFAKLYPPIG